MAKPLTPEEEDEIRRLYQNGHTTLEIEKITGRSHTRINKITKGLPRFSPSSRPPPSPAKNTDIPTRPQVPSPQKKIYIPPPPDFCDPYKISNYSEPDKNQNPSTGMPMDSPFMTDDQNPMYQYINRKLEEFKRDIEQIDRDHGQFVALNKQICELQTEINEVQNAKWRQADELAKKQQDDAIMREYILMIEQMEEELKRLKEYNKKSQKIKTPSGLSSTSPTEPPKNNTTDLKETSVKEAPTQPSAENKPTPVCKPNMIHKDSQPRDLATNVLSDIGPFGIALVNTAPYLFGMLWDSFIAPKTGIYWVSPKQKHLQNKASQKEK